MERRPSASGLLVEQRRQPSRRKLSGAGVESSFTSVKTLKRENSSKKNNGESDSPDHAAGRPASGVGPLNMPAPPLDDHARPSSAKPRFDVRRSYQMDDSDHRRTEHGSEEDVGPTASGSSSSQDISALIQTIQDENNDQPPARPEMAHSKSYSELRSAMGVDRLAEEAQGGSAAATTHEDDGFEDSPPPRTTADAGDDSDHRTPRRRRSSNASDHPHLAGLRTSARSSMDNSLATGLTSAGAKTYDSATKLDTIIRLKLLVAHQQEEIDTLRARMHNLEVLNRSLSDSDAVELRDSFNSLRAENANLARDLRRSQVRESDLRNALAENDELQSQLRKSQMRETDLRNELDRDASLRLELDDMVNDDGQSRRSMGSNEAFILRRNVELQAENTELMQKVVELQVENEGYREQNQRREQEALSSSLNSQSSSKLEIPTRRMPMMNPFRRRTSVSDPGSVAGGLSLLRRCAGGVSLEQELEQPPSNVNLRDNLAPGHGRNLRGPIPNPLDVSGSGRALDGSGRPLLDESGRSLPCIAVARTVSGVPWGRALDRVPSGREVEVCHRPVASGEWTEPRGFPPNGAGAAPRGPRRRASVDVACSQTSRKSSGIRTIATSFTSSFSSTLSTNNSFNNLE